MRTSNTRTATSSFGVSRRQNHDASGFYDRFPAPILVNSEQVEPPAQIDKLWVGDSRYIDNQQIADNSVALIVTSPPYYAGKDYELDTTEPHVPSSYVEYLVMLHDVFKACVPKLEPGGRIAVNVANLGRKPYRSLSADVIRILQDDLGLLLRGEIIWQKAQGASSNCAWGSWRKASNPVLRDVTERVIVASKGRFNRAVPIPKRKAKPLPSESTITAEQFMEATLDLWQIPAESAQRVEHPAPFPVELPERLIRLYTYQGDLVFDPFVGSGTTAVAATKTGRHYVGFDTDASYIQTARKRLSVSVSSLF